MAALFEADEGAPQLLGMTESFASTTGFVNEFESTLRTRISFQLRSYYRATKTTNLLRLGENITNWGFTDGQWALTSGKIGRVAPSVLINGCALNSEKKKVTRFRAPVMRTLEEVHYG